MYSESRISIILIIACLVVQVFVFILGFCGYVALPMTIAMTVGLLLIFLNFFSLQVLFDGEVVRIVYGVGLVSRTVPLELVSETEVVPNNYVTWVYDTSREHVLRLHLRNGARILLGIGDAHRLKNVISSAIRKS